MPKTNLAGLGKRRPSGNKQKKGGHVGPDPLFNTTKELLDRYKEQDLGEKQDEAFYNAVGTAWEVIKYAFDVCG